MVGRSLTTATIGKLNFQKLDVITNELLKRALRFTGRLGVLASEEEEAPVSTIRATLYFTNKRDALFSIVPMKSTA